MAAAAKKPVTFRLSDTTQKELAELAKRHGVSQADVISVLVHCIYMGWDVEQLDDYFDIARLS